MKLPTSSDMSAANAELDELISLAGRCNFDLYEFLRSLDELGVALFQVDHVATEQAGDGIVRDKLADEVLTLLSTLRTQQLVPLKGERSA